MSLWPKRNLLFLRKKSIHNLSPPWQVSQSLTFQLLLWSTSQLQGWNPPPLMKLVTNHLESIQKSHLTTTYQPSQNLQQTLSPQSTPSIHWTHFLQDGLRQLIQRLAIFIITIKILARPPGTVQWLQMMLRWKTQILLKERKLMALVLLLIVTMSLWRSHPPPMKNLPQFTFRPMRTKLLLPPLPLKKKKRWKQMAQWETSPLPCRKRHRHRHCQKVGSRPQIRTLATSIIIMKSLVRVLGRDRRWNRAMVPLLLCPAVMMLRVMARLSWKELPHTKNQRQPRLLRKALPVQRLNQGSGRSQMLVVRKLWLHLQRHTRRQN
mmetsp:Transcript_43596/g.91621  ORF Transcript_43596/g.91621 Transcript_43596/m.91621 type:complete len:321 (+) Transcript_43596:95-1057(+)